MIVVHISISSNTYDTTTSTITVTITSHINTLAAATTFATAKCFYLKLPLLLKITTSTTDANNLHYYCNNNYYTATSDTITTR